MEHNNEEEFKEETEAMEPVEPAATVEEVALSDNEQEGPSLMARINVAAIVIALIILAGAIGFRTGMFDSTSAVASSAQGQQWKEGPGPANGPASSGCNWYSA